MVKNLPAMWETWVRTPGGEEPLEKGMATHSSILVWKIPWTEESDRLQSMGPQKLGHDQANNTHTHTHKNLYVRLYYCLFVFILNGHWGHDILLKKQKTKGKKSYCNYFQDPSKP